MRNIFMSDEHGAGPRRAKGVPRAQAGELLTQMAALAAGDGLRAQGVAQDIAQDIAMARQLGINGVPFFVIGGRYGVSGPARRPGRTRPAPIAPSAPACGPPSPAPGPPSPG